MHKSWVGRRSRGLVAVAGCVGVLGVAGSASAATVGWV